MPDYVIVISTTTYCTMSVKNTYAQNKEKRTLFYVICTRSSFQSSFVAFPSLLKNCKYTKKVTMFVKKQRVSSYLRPVHVVNKADSIRLFLKKDRKSIHEKKSTVPESIHWYFQSEKPQKYRLFFDAKRTWIFFINT